MVPAAARAGKAAAERVSSPFMANESGMLVAADDRSKLRDSAAVVLIRGQGEALEVFWVRRSDRVAFMPGFRAFVGGSVDRSDTNLAIQDVPEELERLLRACALRELFEETGVLLGRGRATSATELSEARHWLLEGETTFSDLARENDWRFHAEDLSFAGRWQTPPFASMRFDTWFYLARVPEGQRPEIRTGELESGEWIAPGQALERWRRGEVTFAAPILHTLLEIARGEADLADRLALAPERAGQPVRRIELKWGIVLQPMKTRPLPPATHTNAYLVGESEMALIDPGSGDPAELEALFDLIDALARDGRRLKMILVTHHHPDHVAGVEAVRNRYRVNVGAHPAAGAAVRADFTLIDRDRLPLAPGPAGDWSLEVVHTPGHARGHLCFYQERTRSLFTGDHIIGGTGTVIIDPPEGDMQAYVGSLRWLLLLDVETLFPGHGSPQGAAERRIQWLIRHRTERENKVLAALGRDPEPLAELVGRVYEDTSRDLWPYAERSLLAHLIKLEREGRAKLQGERWSLA